MVLPVSSGCQITDAIIETLLANDIVPSMDNVRDIQLYIQSRWAAISMQCAVRLRLARSRVARLRLARRHRAAQLIQNAWRGRHARAFMICVSASALLTRSPATRQRHIWTVDCGASRHCVPHKHMLARVTHTQSDMRVQVANGNHMPVQCIGDIDHEIQTADGPARLSLTGVLVVPGFVCCLFSCEHGFAHDTIVTQLNGDRRLVLPTGQRVPFLPVDGRYIVNFAPLSGGVATANSTTLADTDEQIHSRLGHFGISRIRASAGHVQGIDLSHFKGHEECTDCARGAMRNQRFTKQPKKAGETFEYMGQCVTSDLCGPFPPSSPIGFIYAIIFFDRYSKYIAVYYLKSKHADGVRASMKQYIADHKHLLKNGSVQRWHTDNGPEFRSANLDEFCTELSITRSFSVPYRSNTNANAERAWGILLRPTRIVTNAAPNAERWWPFVMAHMVRIHNHLVSRGHDPPAAPVVKANPKIEKPDFSLIRTILCRCLAKIPTISTSKLKPAAYECIYLGYDEKRKGHIVYALELNRITSVASSEVMFKEHEQPIMRLEGPRAPHFSYPGNVSTELPAPAQNQYEPSSEELRRRKDRAATLQPDTAPEENATNPASDWLAEGVAGWRQAQDSPALPMPVPPQLLTNMTMAYAARMITMEKQLVDPELSHTLAWCSGSLVEQPLLIALSHLQPIPLPKTADEALNGPYKKEWLAAMQEDLEGKKRNGMSETIDYDGKEPLMRGKWVFLVKYNTDHSVKKFRARWVAKGYSQVEGLHYTETFSSTMRSTSTRLLIASSVGVCPKTGEKIQRRHIDVDKAFTHSYMDHRVIMEQPHGFATKGKADLLIKALEGTKQAGHLWQELNSDKMRGSGLRQSTIDPCLFYMEKGNNWLRIGVFVDDILAVFNSQELFDEFFTFYKTSEPQIRCHEEGDVEKFTGLEVITSKDNSTITIRQKAYIETMFEKYCVGANSKLWTSPVGSTYTELERFMNITGASTEADRIRMVGKDYLGVIGSLLYAACQTRPDIQYHVSHLAQFMQDPSLEAYEAAIGLICYLYKTRDYGITYGGEIKPLPVVLQAGSEPLDTDAFLAGDGLATFTDASFARDQDLRSVSGFVTMYRNGAISWSSKGLKVVCQSTTEAETAGASIAAKDLSYIRSLMNDIGLPPSGPTPLLIDSSGTYGYTRHQGAKQRTKYFELWVAYVREAYRANKLQLLLITTETEIADVLTKALPRGSLHKFRNIMMNISNSQ